MLDNPAAHTADEHLGSLARAVIKDREFVPAEPVAYRTWGADEIDEPSHAQMRQACRVPVAVGAALMPDAHVGYGLPIGGVLACDNAVIPYAVGVDIACRMKLSVLDLPAESIDTRFEAYREALEHGTCFGVGGAYKTPQSHAVMDQDWSVTRVTREQKDKAWKQLGTSGSGNHFAEFGMLDAGVARCRDRPGGGNVRGVVEPQRQSRRRGGSLLHLQLDRSHQVAVPL